MLVLSSRARASRGAERNHMHRFLVLLPLLAALGVAPAKADELPIFDAHMHYSHDA